MIEVEHLTKLYGQHPAVNDVTFRVEKGSILGFLGPNGAGKSTTMRMLTCYLPVTSGTIRVAGFDVFTNSMEVRRNIGYLPENVPLYIEMRTRKYLDFVAQAKGIPSGKRRAAVSDVIERCGLNNIADRIIRNVSRGYRQRIGLAQALLSDPKVLIFDEPTIGLDPQQIIDIRKLIKSLGGDHTVILSTHILPEVLAVCDRVAIINEGRLVANDTLENLTTKMADVPQIEVEVEGPVQRVLEAINTVQGVTGVTVRDRRDDGTSVMLVESRKGVDPRKDVARVVHDNGWGLLQLKSLGLSLEDIFVRIVSGNSSAK
ncbi:MAG: ATP-binding cassette domain-containing protein [Candidatus Hydrogenedentes bacterium]|nr:ATP-binding cassette domain-containing protein [Candidatus Hydrogenedentota bacterium]